MTRLKFFVFALLTLGLLGYLVYVSPGVTARSADQSSVGLAGAPAAVALRLESQRSDLQAAVIRLAASAAVLNPGPKTPGPKPEAPTVDRFLAVRTVVVDGLPEAHKANIAIGVVNEAGSLFAQGGADPAAAPDGVDLAALAAAALPGGAGTLGSVNGAPVLFYATPLLISDRNEVRTAGSVLIGLPLIPDAKALAESVARDLRLEAVGIISGGAMLGAAGPQKALADKAFKTLKATATGGAVTLESGPVESLGPLKLPVLTSPLPLEMGLRREIVGTPYEVVAVVSSRAAVEGLASFQFAAIAIWAALFLLSIVVGVLLGGEDDGVRMSVPPPLPVPPISRPSPLMSAEPSGSLAMPEPHAPPEASPDDFDFPASAGAPPAPSGVVAAAAVTGNVQAHEPQSDDEASDPFAKMAPAPVPSAPPAYPKGPQANVQTMPQQPAYAPSAPTGSQPFFSPPPPVASQPSGLGNPFDSEPDRTVSYQTGRTGSGLSDPFADAAGQGPDLMNDPSADSTRVAAVPKELLQATRGGTGHTGEQPAIRQPVAPMPRVQSVASPVDEERHFQEVFRDFISTRERCGEVADGLTFEKFKVKLLKNKDQLVTKYSCRTVRFQVYVKDGKAALKATPIKD